MADPGIMKGGARPKLVATVRRGDGFGKGLRGEGLGGEGRGGEIWLHEINGGEISGEDSVTCPHTDALR